MSKLDLASAWRWWSAAAALRWALGGLLLTAGLVALLSGSLEVCEQQVAQTGERGVVSVCRQPAVTDPSVLMFILLVLILAWPDISAISVGIVQITRTVEQQTDKVGREISEMRQAVDAQLTQMTQQFQLTTQQLLSQQVANQRVSQNLYFGTAAVVGESPTVTTGRPSTDVGSLKELLAPIRDQLAYETSGLPEAQALVAGMEQRPVRVALIGDAVDPEVLSLAAIESRVTPPYITQNAAERGIGVGAASLGHILAIAPRAVVSPVSVLSEGGSGSSGDLQEGLVAALATRPQVMLLGVGFPAPTQSGQRQSEDHAIERLLARQAGKAVLVVAPAGNDSQPGSGWPAALDGVISVAAVDGEGRRAQFSNFGVGVDLAAPGVGVTCLVGASSGRPTFREMSGTSFSADIVAGVATLLMSISDHEPSEILAMLLDASSRRTPDGTPILDASAAVQLALGGTTRLS